MKQGRIPFFAFLILIILQISVFADYKKEEPVVLEDADGTKHSLFVTGDEYVRVIHDADNFVMLKTEQGYFEYAKYENGTLLPNGNNKALKYTDIPSEYFTRERDKIFDVMEKEGMLVPGRGIELYSADTVKEFMGEGTVILVPIAFSGGSTDFNGFTNSVENACDYYDEISYGKLKLDYMDVSLDTPIFVTEEDELYFHPQSSTNEIGYTSTDDRMERENALVKAAIEYYGLGDKTTDMPLDVDKNGRNDFLVFVYNTKYESVWNSLLWPHQVTYTYSKYNVFGKGVANWIFMPRSGGDSTLCHEMYHSMGAPDLYDYTGVNDYIGMWDIMDSGNGTMLTYMKYKYGGWIDEIPEITEEGTYTLNAAYMEDNNCYKVPINENEYYVLEYRSRYTGHINYLDRWRQWHNEGLLITRVTKGISGNEYPEYGVEIDLVKHPALGQNSILGAVLPEFSPNSGHDRSLQTGGTDDTTVIKNICENEDGTLSFDLSFDGISEKEYILADNMEIRVFIVKSASGKSYVILEPCTTSIDENGKKIYEALDSSYGVEYIYLTGKESSASVYEYTEYTQPFLLEKSGVLWAYIKNSDNTRTGAPKYAYIHYTVPGINTARKINSWEYNAEEIFGTTDRRLTTLNFSDGDQFVGKMNMDDVISFNVDGAEYEYLSEDIRGKTMSFSAESVSVDAGDGSEVYMTGLAFSDYATYGKVIFDSGAGRSSIFEKAETIVRNDLITLSTVDGFSGEIRYTTDGTAPDINSVLYTEPFSLNADTVIRYATFSDGALVTSDSFNVYVQSDYREYSTDELNRIFKNSCSCFSGGEGKYLMISYTPGEGSLILRDSDWIDIKKIINPTDSGVIYLDASDEIFVKEATGDNITVTVVDGINQLGLTYMEDEVVIRNYGDAIEASLIIASYNVNRMEAAVEKKISLGEDVTKIPSIEVTGDAVKMFVVRSLSDITPLSNVIIR